MSFLNTELRSAFNSLNHDILRQQFNPPTPPLSPESPTTTHIMLASAASSHEMAPSAFESSRGEPTSVISYEKSRNFTSTTSKLDSMNRFSSSYPHSSGQCLCCPQKQYISNIHALSTSRSSYQSSSFRDVSNSPLEELSKTMMREPEPFYQKLPQSYSTEKVILAQPPPLKRRFESEPIDVEIPSKKLKLNNETIACQVHGILSLPGSREPRYDISKTELERRVNEPECLTKVDMISYVRLAKNSARTLLEKNEIKTNQHNKRSEHTVLSKMCEAECQVLAQGLREINFRYFPGIWFAKKSVEEISTNSSTTRQQREALKERLKEDEITKCVLLDIYFGLERRHHDEEMRNFNLMSHSFGIPNLKNHILFLYRYLEEEARILKRIFTHS